MRRSIKSCPFCGGPGATWASLAHDGAANVYVYCEECGARGQVIHYEGDVIDVLQGEAKVIDEVIDLWNSRSK